MKYKLNEVYSKILKLTFLILKRDVMDEMYPEIQKLLK